jgi:hypothetical protein
MTNQHKTPHQLENWMKGILYLYSISSPTARVELENRMEILHKDYVELTGHNYQPIFDELNKRNKPSPIEKQHGNTRKHIGFFN